MTGAVRNAPGRSASGSGEITLRHDEFRLFQRFIREEAGIRVADHKQALISGRLHKRVRALGLSSFRKYFEFIVGKPASEEQALERQLALDLLTTNETYFFREPKHFAWLQQQLLPASSGSRLRVWSAASSSGEEAWSLAMVLDASRGPREWEVVGTDISDRMVRQAASGRYPLARAEKIPAPYLTRYCLKGTGSHEGEMRIGRELRSRVRFERANLLREQRGLGMFDLVVLRNVMIYFDEDTKRTVLRNVLRQLHPGGYLLIGHSESLNGMADGLVSVQPAVYRKAVD